MKCEDFIELLIAMSGGLLATHQTTLDEWRPDVPPVTTLFAALGARIAVESDDASEATNQKIFSLVEGAMECGDTQLTTAVATGLLEGLVGRAARTTGKLERITPFLGPRSLQHVKAWMSF